MAQNESKSKLKREKLSARGNSPKIRTGSVLSKPAETQGQLWWKRRDLPAVEQLWASALEWMGPEESGRFLVPELPLPVVEQSGRGFREESQSNITQEAPPVPAVPHQVDLRPSSSSLAPPLIASPERLEVETPQLQDGEEKKNVSEEQQGCPLCLLVFPPSFTQLDRDGHLAECLSEMNEDITW
ncbi:Fanconi anemia core complex-associated protein 20 isoform X1 [Synchiropus splendidus]|uniref:Fanconi anemia core complex-associated protein 20 isoform X1 n=1 Tax=Synchiropus splendidus TaxID=270530 RepID=UPI00237D9050|nr:Fanconi anemia core complex-associated protein 20 isoform X1 [Synchiropus splendidus]